MTTLLWITDPHFNFLGASAWSYFKHRLAFYPKEVPLVITGDIAESRDFSRYLKELEQDRNVYFVLGNHDFYGDSIAAARDCARSRPGYLEWRNEPVRLSDTACLVGVDGWYDFNEGAGADTQLRMSDWGVITDFKDKSMLSIAKMSALLAKQSAKLALKKLELAFAKYKTVYLATHVPPFLGASLSPRRLPSDKDWAPVMVNTALGEALRSVRLDKFVHVLCGHTHTEAHMVVPVNGLGAGRANVKVSAGRANYGEVFIEELHHSE